jgi:hypothetical protein
MAGGLSTNGAIRFALYTLRELVEAESIVPSYRPGADEPAQAELLRLLWFPQQAAALLRRKFLFCIAVWQHFS